MAARFSGSIVALASREAEAASGRAASLGKLEDRGPISMYYRKLKGNHVMTFLVPTTYPQTVLEAASAVTVARAACLVSGYDLDWRDGELMLLLSSAPLQVRAVESPVPEKVSAVLRSPGLEGFSVGPSGSCDGVVSGLGPAEASGDGIVVVDRAFNVRGVGLVMLGFSKLGRVGVHDELMAVPSMRAVTVKSVEVLDESVDEAGPDVRVGLALKGASLDDVEGAYLLVRETGQVLVELEARVARHPWGEEVRPGRQYHLAALGVVAPATVVSTEGDRAVFRVSRPLPRADRYVLIDVNVRPPRPRVLGVAEPLGV